MADRSVLVTGGGRGVGRAIALRFAAAGERVVAVGRDRTALEQVARDAPGTLDVEECDVTDEEAVAALFGRVGAIDVLVNNAGVSTAPRLPRTTSTMARHSSERNRRFLCTRAALPGMPDRDRGRIVMVASTAGRRGLSVHRRLHGVKACGARTHACGGARARGHAASPPTPSARPSWTEMTHRSAARIAPPPGARGGGE